MKSSALIAVGFCGILSLAAGCTTEESGTGLLGAAGGTSAGGVGGVGGPRGQGGRLDAPVADAPSPGDGGSCDPALDKALGAFCGCGAECASGFCSDGVCCNTQCSGACVTCNQPTRVGECTAVRAGVQAPHGRCAKEAVDTCGLDGTCNGVGACSRYSAGVICKPPSCSGSGLTPASSCDGNGVCLAGSPINCSPSMCVDGACKVVCTSKDDCVVPHDCTNGSCGLRGLGQPCERGTQCKSGQCADGVCCDSPCTGKCSSCGLPPSLGRCVPVGADAPDPRVAAGVTDPALICADQGAASCGTNGRCDGTGGCQRYADGTGCKDQSCDAATDRWTRGSVCMAGACVTPAARSCAPYKCGGDRCESSCTATRDCASGQTCLQGSCGKKPQGSLCARDVECSSNFCSQGVCCNGRCGGVCQSCNVPGSQGACIAVPPGGDDPTGTCRNQGAASCGNDGTCNGTGGCRKFRFGTTCAAARCANGTVTPASLCTGTGTCVAGTPRSCQGIICDLTRPQCLSGCSRDWQCIAPNTCQSGKCGQSDPGGPCEDRADCKQTPSVQFCVSGICCNLSSCSGCKTCATGTCLNVDAGKVPTNASCAVNPANAVCGNNGTCDGTGKCTVAAAGTSCGTTCSSGSRVASTCPGNGAMCSAGAPMSCSPFACSMGACVTGPCTDNADCAAGKVCTAGMCKTCNPTNNEGCPVGQVCSSDACKVPLGGACTSSGQCVSGSCVGSRCCDCPPANRCTDAGCNSAGACNFHAVGSACTDPVCNMASDGLVVNTCDGTGTCTSATMTTMCPAPQPKCVSGACQALGAAGSNCGGDGDCMSNVCLGGKCCTAACNGGADAGCVAIACSATGACSYPGSSKTCGAATCPDSTTSSTPVCDGAGKCDAVDLATCGPGRRCTGGVCPGTCSGDGDCLADYTCAGGTCKKRPGTSCGGTADCAAGNCVGGRCCNSNCAQTDDNCGVGCNTDGSCVFSPATTICAGPGCDGSNNVTVSKCNGAGVCAAEPPLSCGVLTCAAGLCGP